MIYEIFGQILMTFEQRSLSRKIQKKNSEGNIKISNSIHLIHGPSMGETHMLAELFC
jgi:hypothetical protein